MAVPKKRSTSSTRGQRRSHDALVEKQMVSAKNSTVPVPRRVKRAVELGLISIKKD